MGQCSHPMVGDINQREGIQIAIIIATSYLMVQLGKRLIRRRINKTYNDPEENEDRVTGLKFLYNTLSFLVYTFGVIAIIYTIPPLQSIGKTLFAGAGIFAAILGFASQQAFSNIIGGIFLVLFKPFRVGDLIRVGSKNEGFVEDITLRHTVIRDFENKRIVIPNSLISTETIHNSTIKDSKILNRIHFSISYESNIDVAIDIIKTHAMSHPNYIDNRSQTEMDNGTSPVDVKVISWDDSGITLRAYVWTKSQGDGFTLKTDMFYSVKKAFEENNIEIPYPHQVHLEKLKP